MIKKLIVSNLKEDKQHILFGLVVAIVIAVITMSQAMRMYTSAPNVADLYSIPNNISKIMIIAVVFSIYCIYVRFGYLLDKNKQEFYKSFPCEKKDMFFANYVTVLIEFLCIVLVGVSLLIGYDLILNKFDILAFKVLITTTVCAFTLFHMVLSLIILCKSKGIFIVNTIMMFMVLFVLSQIMLSIIDMNVYYMFSTDIQDYIKLSNPLSTISEITGMYYPVYWIQYEPSVLPPFPMYAIYVELLYNVLLMAFIYKKFNKTSYEDAGNPKLTFMLTYGAIYLFAGLFITSSFRFYDLTDSFKVLAVIIIGILFVNFFIWKRTISFKKIVINFMILMAISLGIIYTVKSTAFFGVYYVSENTDNIVKINLIGDGEFEDGRPIHEMNIIDKEKMEIVLKEYNNRVEEYENLFKAKEYTDTKPISILIEYKDEPTLYLNIRDITDSEYNQFKEACK